MGRSLGNREVVEVGEIKLISAGERRTA